MTISAMNMCTNQLLRPVDSAGINGSSSDLVERDDGDACLQLAALQQLLAHHLSAHNHVVQLGNMESIWNNLHA